MSMLCAAGFTDIVVKDMKIPTTRLSIGDTYTFFSAKKTLAQ